VGHVCVCVLLAELDKLKFGVKSSTKYTSGETRVYHNLQTLPIHCLKTKIVEMAVCNVTWTGQDRTGQDRTGQLGVPLQGKIIDWGS